MPLSRGAASTVGHELSIDCLFHVEMDASISHEWHEVLEKRRPRCHEYISKSWMTVERDVVVDDRFAGSHSQAGRERVSQTLDRIDSGKAESAGCDGEYGDVWTMSGQAQFRRTFDAVGSKSKGEPWTRRQSESYETRSTEQPTADDVTQELRRNSVSPFLSFTENEKEESSAA
jgi:hypothetical protein